MKKVVLFVLIALLLAGCAPTVSTLVGLPDEGRLLVLELVTAGLTWLLLKLGEWLKIDLSGYVQPLAAVIAPIIIAFIEQWLGLIPPIFDDLVLAIIHILVLLLGSLGAWLVFRRVKTKTTKTLLV